MKLAAANHKPVTQPSPLVCFLEKLQETAYAIFGGSDFDPKVYMDMSLKFDLGTTKKAFDKLVKSKTRSVTVDDFNEFTTEFLNQPGIDMVYHEPGDFIAEPDEFLLNVKNAEVRAWALEVHSLWKTLCRKVDDRVRENPELHTLLPLPEPVIVPGSRFKEIYYWDSYWIIRGLLVSKMYETAKSIVHSLVSQVNQYGHVLNGARSYYSNRSQPPFLSSMVLEVYNRTLDTSLVKASLPALLKEHKFWSSGIHKVVIQDGRGCSHNLSRYFAMWNKPRPETATIDLKLSSKFVTVSEKRRLYRELASTAETGWDFSSRWMKNHSDLATLATTSILPVDLNAYVLKMELDIAVLAKIVGHDHTAECYVNFSNDRRQAMTSIFWNEELGQWLDYWLDSNDHDDIHTWKSGNQNPSTFASNFIPIWVESFYTDDFTPKNVVHSLQTSGLLCAGGISTSLTNSGQQWDFPNGWAPIQHMIVEGLARFGSKDARSLAENIVVNWLKANYAAYKKTSTMHEKYDVGVCGLVGAGGEYPPQTGFGWTNGVALAFLEEFGWPEDREIDG